MFIVLGNVILEFAMHLVQILVDLLLFSNFSKTTSIRDFNLILLFNFQII